MLPLPALTAPFRVSVLAPIPSAPLVSVKLPFTVLLAASVTPAALLMARLLNVAKPLTPWAAEPLKLTVLPATGWPVPPAGGAPPAPPVRLGAGVVLPEW